VIQQFPHCDARVLHAPGECRFCDLHPEWQQLRKAWMIAFTGHEPAEEELPCPADYDRPPGSVSDHRRWAGNVATTQQPVNETGASRLMYSFEGLGDLPFEVVEEPVTQATAGPPPKRPGVWLSFRRKQR
jgi:hypothetical protein